MQVGGLRWGHRSPAQLDAMLARAQGAELSYAHVGSTLGGATPPGARERRFEREAVGTVADAAAALRAWAAHRGIRARIHPSSAALEEGASLLVVIPAGPLQLAVPNRVVRVVDEAERFGFVYGTLTGHDEAGEELFLAEASGPGRLRLQIVVHARAASRPARLVGLAVGLLSDAAARRYLDAWAEAIERPTPS